MDAVFSQFDLVLKAFRLTIELFVLVRRAVAAARHAARRRCAWARSRCSARRGALYVTLVRSTPLLIIFIFVFFGLPQLDIQLPFLVKGVVVPHRLHRPPSCARRSARASTPSRRARPRRPARSGSPSASPCGTSSSPRPCAPSVPPLASVLIALAKNTSVAAGFGLLEATARMRFFTNDQADARTLIFITFAIGYIIIVELISARGLRPRAPLEGGPMSSSVLFDVPGPRTRRPAPALHRPGRPGAGGAGRRSCCVRMKNTGQLAYDKWEPFLTPEYISPCWSTASSRPCRWRSPRSSSRCVFGVVFGIGKLSDHAWIRWPGWAVVEFFRAVPVLLMMIYIFFTYGAGQGGIGVVLVVVIALTLYNGAVLAEVFRAGIQAVPKGQARGGVRHRDAQVPGDEADPDARRA